MKRLRYSSWAVWGCVLLAPLTAAAQPPAEREAAEYQVRLLWLITVREEPSKLPDDLKDMAAELTRHGLEKSRLAAQVAVPVTSGYPFEMAGVVQLDAPLRLTVSGMATGKKEAVSLEITLNATQAPAGREARPVVSLHTTLTAPLGRPVLLGVVPTEAQTSAFVLLVQSRQPPSTGEDKATDASMKRIPVEFLNAPWSKVLDWLSDQTGLPVIASDKPAGTFNFVPARAARFTIPEVIDILNEGLMQQKFILIRREHSFLLAAADEKIDGVPRIGLDELAKRGQTELVSVIIPLKAASAEEIAPEVKKMLGPFGEVTVVKNQLIVQDMAGNVRRIVALLKEIEK